ncbi:MAG: outer membrane beta-barrel protein [Rickettsiales bacterium]|nr:outer membrane beta-barrel protein [Rickettsiales bacterium]
MPAQGTVVREWFNNLRYIRTTSFDLFSIKSNSNVHSNKDGVYSIAFGKDLKSLSTEVLLRNAHKHRSQANGLTHNIKMHSLFFNVYLKRNSSQRVVPYLMGGVGASYNTSRPTNQMIDGNNNSMLYDIGAGVFIKITNKLLLDFNCKYVNLGSVGVSNNQSIQNVTSREFLLNLVYKF